MANVSILSVIPSVSNHNENTYCEHMAITSAANYPFHSAEKMGQLVQKIGQHHFIAETTEVNASLLLSLSAHTPNTFGSPGTLLFTKKEGSQNGQGQMTAFVVNELGEKSSYDVRQFVGGWMIGKDTTVYKTFSALSQALLSGMQNILGADCCGIPFFSEEQIAACIDKLSREEKGTYVTFAHIPLTDLAEADASISPKRNFILWMGIDGKIEQAQFHYDPTIDMWLNGGPIQGYSTVLSNRTLQGLIEEKISLSLGEQGRAKALNLGV